MAIRKTYGLRTIISIMVAMSTMMALTLPIHADESTDMSSIDSIQVHPVGYKTDFSGEQLDYGLLSTQMAESNRMKTNQRTLESLNANDSMRALSDQIADNRIPIIGSSLRTKGYRSVVFIVSYFNAEHTGNMSTCSGSLIAPNVVLTAGHCLYDDGMQHGDFTVVPARDGSIKSDKNEMNGNTFVPDVSNTDKYPYGAYGTTNMWFDQSWLDSYNRNQDWGILFLDRNVVSATDGSPVSVLDVDIPNADNYEQYTVDITGYPGTYPDETKGPGMMFTATGKITKNSTYDKEHKKTYDYVWETNVPISSGQSGGPTWIINDEYNPIIIGINESNRGKGEVEPGNFLMIHSSLLNIINNARN